MTSSGEIRQLPRYSLSDAVYRVLRDKIISKAFPPGSRLDLKTLGQQIGTSRSPINYALQRLQTEGLVQIIPYKGTFVTVLTPEDILELYDMRRVLEVYAAEVCVQNITESDLLAIRQTLDALDRKLSTDSNDQVYLDCLELDHQFHGLIVESAHNSRLKRFWEQVNVHAQVARVRYGTMDVAEDFPSFQQEHRAMMDALENGDSALLSRLASDHIERAKQRLLDTV